jgi:hypothetical protein
LVDLAEDGFVTLRPLLGFDGDQVLKTGHVVLQGRFKLLY